MTAQALAAFARLVPDLLPMAPLLEDVINVPIPSTPEASAIEPRFRPARVADTVVRLIEATVRGPFVLMVEEGHWSDAASITVLDRIAAATPGRPWAVVVARRTDAGGFAPETGTEVVLEPLAEDVMRRIVLAATESAPLHPHEVDEIARRAGGNPLYVEELARVFREVGSLEAMPDSLHAALDAQIDALDPHSRRVLRYASVLGRSFRTEVLDETLRVESLEADADTLSRLAGFLEADGRDRLRFRTGMIRDAAYEGLAYRLRTKLHGAAGRAVESLSQDLDADADTLSLHYWRGGDPRATWRFARLAGDRAARAYANADAAVQYERAIEASKSLDDVTDAERLALWRRIGEVRELAGMYESAIAAFRRASTLALGDRSMTVGLLLQRARTHQRMGAYASALRELTQLQRLTDGDTSLEARRARVRGTSMRSGIRNEQERLVEAMALARGVIDESREVGEIEALEQALIQLDTAAFQTGDTSVGELTREALRLCLEHGHLQRASIAQVCLGGFAFYTGRWDEAVESFEGARRSALAVGDVVGAAVTSLSLGEVYVDRGALEEADDVLTDAVRVLRVAGSHAFAAYGQVHLARILLLRGELVAAEALAEDVELELAVLGQKVSALEATLVRAEAVTRQGRPAESLDLVEVSADSAKGEGVALLPRVHLERTRALLHLDRVEQAAFEVSEGLRVARLYQLPYEEAGLLRLHADVLRAQGDQDAAAEADADARAILDRLVGVSA